MNKVKVFLVPGLGKQNKSEMQSLGFYTSSFANSVSMYNYDSTEESNLKRELENIVKFLEKREDSFVIAKSDGASLIMEAINNKKISPRACVFIDLPSKHKNIVYKGATLLVNPKSSKLDKRHKIVKENNIGKIYKVIEEFIKQNKP